ncbi:MAG TPA: flagellar hook-length control protein FliK, partial [Steroidobacteraceae bacterium]|nr:flagellar hook-length control protein FliK [Steroidobacteraceae bacterium]
AWMAQVLMPPTNAVQPATSPASSSASTSSAGQTTTGAALVGSVTAAATATAAATIPAVAGAAASLTAGAAAAALRARSDASELPQAPTPPAAATTVPAAEAAQATPATLDGINAMADVQKLISGMTAANTTATGPDSDEDAPSAPATHATTSGSADGTPGAAALQASTLTRNDGPPGGVTLTIQAPVGSAAFADEVSARVSGLAQSGITQAQLQLSPADLGPVQVHITMQAGQASVWFGANHADTRAALEQSLPRLRELFAGAGMPLTDSGVFREPPQPQQAQSLPIPSSARSGGNDTLSTPTVTQVSNIRLSLLDTYA